MCNFEPKLIALIDDELSVEEAERVERHLSECNECRERLARYKDVSKGLVAYCEVVARENAPDKKQRWTVPVLSLVAAVIVVFFLAWTRSEKPIVQTPEVLTASIPAVEKNEIKPALVKPIRRRHRVATKEISRQTGNWRSTGGAVQIAIPADSMFAPGAVPQGMNFIAELRIAPDGSVEQVLLRQ